MFIVKKGAVSHDGHKYRKGDVIPLNDAHAARLGKLVEFVADEPIQNSDIPVPLENEKKGNKIPSVKNLTPPTVTTANDSKTDLSTNPDKEIQ
jgi:hypothetical protein